MPDLFVSSVVSQPVHGMLPSTAAETFVLNPANRPFLNGETDRLPSPGATSCALLFLVPFALVGILFLGGFVLHAWAITAQIALDGVPVQAVITDLLIKAGDEGGNSYYVLYHFTTQDRQVGGMSEIDGDYYSQLTKGAPINILYVRTNPEITRVPNQRHDLILNIAVPGIALVWNAIVFVVMGSLIISGRRNARLTREGCFLPGQVVDCQGQIDGDGDLIVTLDYTFPSPQGSTINGKERCTRNDLKTGRKPKCGVLPRPGTPVTVLYVDDACFRVM